MKRLFKSGFLKNVALIAGGTAFAQLLNIVLSPVITRIYSPEEYGVLTIYTAILGLISLAAFKYEMAIPISKNDKIAINVLVLCMIVLSLFVLILFIVLFLFGNKLLIILNFTAISKYWYLIPIGVFLSGLYTIFRLWAFRIKDFKSISKTTVNQSIFSNLTKVASGLAGIGAIGLVLGTIIGQSSGIRVLSKPVLKRDRNLFKYVSFTEIKRCLVRFKEFPIYNAPNKFLISIGLQLPVMFLATFYGSAVVGSFGLAYTIVKLPMNLIGNSVGDVFFSEAASMGNENPEKIKKLSNKLIKKLILIGLIPLLLLLFLGPQLFSLVFGSDWYIAGVYSQIISVMLFFTLVFTPVSRIYEVFEKQKSKFFIDLVRIILVVIAFGLAWIFNWNSYMAILMYSVVMSIIYFITYLYALKILNAEINKKDLKQIKL